MKGTKTPLVVILLALTVTLAAQRSQKQTVVLNGGSRITGTVLAADQDSVKMRITTPQVITLKKSDVEQGSAATVIERQHIDRHGYTIGMSASSLTGRKDEENVGSMSFLISNGYSFRNGLSLGIGTGYEEIDVAVMPLYADFRYHPLKTRMSPFAWVKGGWSFAFGDLDNGQYYYYDFPKARGGIMYCAGAGIELASWGGNAVNFGVGYRFQKITFKYSESTYMTTPRELVTSYNRIEVQVGFVFR